MFEPKTGIFHRSLFIHRQHAFDLFRLWFPCSQLELEGYKARRVNNVSYNVHALIHFIILGATPLIDKDGHLDLFTYILKKACPKSFNNKLDVTKRFSHVMKRFREKDKRQRKCDEKLAKSDLADKASDFGSDGEDDEVAKQRLSGLNV